MTKNEASFQKKCVVEDGITTKFHANGKTIWSKGQMLNGHPHGYWQWFRLDGTLKRSGSFDNGKPIGVWTTYDAQGNVQKQTIKN